MYIYIYIRGSGRRARAAPPPPCSTTLTRSYDTCICAFDSPHRTVIEHGRYPIVRPIFKLRISKF